MTQPDFLIVDLFCGAGGTTTGFDMATREGNKIAKVIACVNHDWKAIKSHWQNHPDVKHYTEDIRTLDLTELTELTRQRQLLYPNAKLILWASLECTNFSKAKGGQPRDADSRTLADHLDRYIIALNPDYIQIENVVEFMSWGPLDDNGKPVSRKSGSDWMRWRKHIDTFGYRNEWKELNSADFGAYTSRNRLFGCFAKPGLPIVWPEATHGKKPATGTMFSANVYKWKAVKDVLDFEDEGESIFTRKKELSPKTLERIYAGLIKYVAGGKNQFLLKYNSLSSKGVYHAPSVDEPCPVVATQNRLGMCFINKYYSGNPDNMICSVDEPAPTIRTKDGIAVTQCFLAHYYGSGGQTSSVENPAPVIPTKARTAKIWLDKSYSSKHNHQSVEEPCGTILSKDKFATIQCSSWIDRNFSSGGQHSSIEEPAGSILNIPKLNLVQAEPFILNGNFGHDAPVTDPAPVLTASRRHHYIVNPSHGGHSTSTDAPCPVIIARQDKAPLYLLQVEHAEVNIPVYDDEPQIMIDIKVFMCLYGISDIKMRMLKVLELLKIQGFPSNYKLYGNQSDQKKFIGNSVVPHVVKAWCEAMGNIIIEEQLAA